MRSTNSGCAVIQPNLQPGATVFEKVSSLITRPSVSMLMELGTRESKNAYPLDFQSAGLGSAFANIGTSGLDDVL